MQLTAQLEAIILSDRSHEEFIRAAAPDAALLSPLLHSGSAQTDFVKSAQQLGIPVGKLLFSWDDLSTKGAMYVIPNHVFVWNERQRRETTELHGGPETQIHVTGAPRFDRFFELEPRTSREASCGALGLDSNRPLVAYLCSSKFVSERELDFSSRIGIVACTAPHTSFCARPTPWCGRTGTSGFAIESGWRPNDALTSERRPVQERI